MRAAILLDLALGLALWPSASAASGPDAPQGDPPEVETAVDKAPAPPVATATAASHTPTPTAPSLPTEKNAKTSAGGSAAQQHGTAWWSPLEASLSLDAQVGVGTFVGNQKTDDPYYASTLSIEPAWAFDEAMRAGFSLALSYEWTYLVTPCHAASGPRAAGAPLQDCSDTNDANRERAALEDLELFFSHGAIFVDGPFTLSGRASVALPTSRASRYASNILTLGASTAGELVFAPVSIKLSVGMRKFFPTAEAQVMDALEAEAHQSGGVPIGRCASFRQDNCLLMSGFVANWRFSTDLTVATDIPWVEGLSASVSFGYGYARRFGREPDALTSTKYDGDGYPVVTGVNEDDSTTGNIEVAYAVDDHLSFALGTYSAQPARTSDGRGIRFPFYDFISPAQNFTVWYLAGSYSL